MRQWNALTMIAIAVPFVGCRSSMRTEPFVIANSDVGRMTIAVAPAINLSGSTDFDPARFADLMASELSYADGVSVIPVSRVLGVLAVQGLDRVASPSHAIELTKLLGANAVLVFSVTEYDPYDPPSIGISAQLYGARSRPGIREVDPISLSRRATGSAAASRSRKRVLAQTQRVFDASHGRVIHELQQFASFRGADQSPYGWRKYVVSQQSFIRFCCYATIRSLLNGEPEINLAARGRER